MAAVFSHLNIICARYSLHDHDEPHESVVMRWEHGGLKEENKNIIEKPRYSPIAVELF